MCKLHSQLHRRLWQHWRLVFEEQRLLVNLPLVSGLMHASSIQDKVNNTPFTSITTDIVSALAAQRGGVDRRTNETSFLLPSTSHHPFVSNLQRTSNSGSASILPRRFTLLGAIAESTSNENISGDLEFNDESDLEDQEETSDKSVARFVSSDQSYSTGIHTKMTLRWRLAARWYARKLIAVAWRLWHGAMQQIQYARWLEWRAKRHWLSGRMAKVI